MYEDPSAGPGIQVKKLGMVVYAYNPSTGKAEVRESLWLVGWLATLAKSENSG